MRVTVGVRPIIATHTIYKQFLLPYIVFMSLKIPLILEIMSNE